MTERPRIDRIGRGNLVLPRDKLCPETDEEDPDMHPTHHRYTDVRGGPPRPPQSSARADSPYPENRDYASSADPDCNTWLIQGIGHARAERQAKEEGTPP
jgi:hypothetical protein